MICEGIPTRRLDADRICVGYSGKDRILHAASARFEGGEEELHLRLAQQYAAALLNVNAGGRALRLHTYTDGYLFLVLR